MKYKVGDKVRVRKDLQVSDYFGKTASNSMTAHAGREVTIRSFYGNRFEQYYTIEEDDGEYKWTEAMFEGLANEVPSIVKRINDKHNILNGLLNSDDGEKLASNSEEAKTKGSHYEKAAMQPLEVAQRMFTKEQFKAILIFQVMKYRLRKEYKGQKESDEYKALQYCYWLELADKGITIDPSKDKVPTGYKYKGVIL